MKPVAVGHAGPQRVHDRQDTTDWLTILALFAAAAVDAVMLENYYRMSLQTASIVSIGVMAICVSALFLMATRWQSRKGSVAARGLVLASAAIAWSSLVGVRTIAWMMASYSSSPALTALTGVAAGMAAIGLVIALLSTRTTRWLRVRAALLAGLWLFVGSQPLIGWLRAPELQWPPGFVSADASADRGRVVTLVLLLDELNARNSGPIVAELKLAGMQVAMQAVPSVGGSTANVVPSLFAGRIFDDSRPCGATTICSRSTALDFSRIHASRPDIDVVGFFHPYCAIDGLRSCVREAVGKTWFDVGRWRCGLWRRFGWPTDVTEAECRRVLSRSWGAMVDALSADAQSAPALTQGGLLFAHVPLPHPPGVMFNEPLETQYLANVDRAAALVRALLGTSRKAGLETRVVIFSDHPLRQPVWCETYPPYVWDGCHPVDRLRDDRVPIIVAGLRTPDLSGFRSNLDVFSLASKWMAQPDAQTHRVEGSALSESGLAQAPGPR